MRLLLLILLAVAAMGQAARPAPAMPLASSGPIHVGAGAAVSAPHMVGTTPVGMDEFHDTSRPLGEVPPVAPRRAKGSSPAEIDGISMLQAGRQSAPDPIVQRSLHPAGAGVPAPRARRDLAGHRRRRLHAA